MPIRTALLGILPPIVIAAIVLLLGWRPWSAKPARWCGVASALALALAYAITDTLVGGGWPGMPPLDTHRWLPFLALAAALPVFLAPVSASGGRNWARFVLLNATAAIGLFLVLPAHHGDESLFHIALATLVVTVMVALTRMNLSVLGAGGGVRVPLMLMISAIGTSLVSLQSHFAFMAQMAGSIAAVYGVFVVLAWWRSSLELARGLAPVHALLFAGVILSIHTTGAAHMLMVAMFITPWNALSLAIRRLPSGLLTVLCVALVSILAVFAIAYSTEGFDFGGY